jgi:hypothetical protein
LRGSALNKACTRERREAAVHMVTVVVFVFFCDGPGSVSIPVHKVTAVGGCRWVPDVLTILGANKEFGLCCGVAEMAGERRDAKVCCGILERIRRCTPGGRAQRDVVKLEVLVEAGSLAYAFDRQSSVLRSAAVGTSAACTSEVRAAWTSNWRPPNAQISAMAGAAGSPFITWVARLCCKLLVWTDRSRGVSLPRLQACWRLSVSPMSAMVSVSTEGPRPNARSTMRASPRMSRVRLKIVAWPLRRASITSNPAIVA